MWSPLILLHQIANAHNDLLMGCLIVAAFYTTVRGRPFWLIPLLVAAVTIKYTALVFLPFAMAFVLRKQGLIRLIGSGLAGAAVLILTGLPYLGQMKDFIVPLIVGQTNKFTAGTITSALYYTYRAVSRRATPLGSLEEFGGFLQATAAVVVAISLLLIAYRFLRSPMSPQHLLRAWTLSILAVMFASPQFYAWYFGGFFPFALLLAPGMPLRELVVILSVTHLSSLAAIGSKAIGYFLFATVGGLIWWRKKVVAVHTHDPGALS
jgi:hypothetical protein